MAIAINNFSVATMNRRDMAAVYRRRRVVVLLAIATLAVSVSFAMLNNGSGIDRVPAQNSLTPKFVIAESDDTLWAIAQRIAPTSNITEVVDQLILMNGDQITPGQLVRIP